MKRVGMFVWNHFTNDARVLRECTTLSQNGYDVELICIDDPTDPTILRYEEINEHFKVYRLKEPFILLFMQGLRNYYTKNKWIVIPIIAIWLLLVYFSPILAVLLMVPFVLLSIRKVRILFSYVTLIIKMTLKGYKGGYDIYHSNDLNTLPQGFVSAKFRFKKKVLIYDSHEVQTSRTGYNGPWYALIEKKLIKYVDKMMVENHTRAKHNEELYGFYPAVLHNYPSLEIQNVTESVNLHKLLDLPFSEKILLYQGGLQSGRGLEKLIEAYPLFKQGVLVFIGDGEIKVDLQKQVKEMELEEKVFFIPKVPVMELPKYTKNAYLGFQVLNNVCFNHWSASSNKLFEYMMNEVPVVASNFPEIKRVVEESEVGVVIDPHDPLEIASGVNYLLEHPEKREFFSNNCKKARKKYNWEREQKNLLDVYKEFNLD